MPRPDPVLLLHGQPGAARDWDGVRAAIGISAGGRLANPLANARHYYCLGTDNVSIGNYEAGTPHFPIKYRQGVPRGQTADADVLIYWRVSPGAARPGWEEVFAQGDLRIYRRQQEP